VSHPKGPFAEAQELPYLDGIASAWLDAEELSEIFTSFLFPITFLKKLGGKPFNSPPLIYP
jgi:hypothetical protein